MFSLVDLGNLEAMRANLLPRWGHRIYIPRPIRELSSRHVLGMELLKGEKHLGRVLLET